MDDNFELRLEIKRLNKALDTANQKIEALERGAAQRLLIDGLPLPPKVSDAIRAAMAVIAAADACDREAERNLAALRSAVKSFCDGFRHALGHEPCSSSIEKDLRRWETAFRRLLGVEDG